jgi:hypothetical protein
LVEEHINTCPLNNWLFERNNHNSQNTIVNTTAKNTTKPLQNHIKTTSKPHQKHKMASSVPRVVKDGKVAVIYSISGGFSTQARNHRLEVTFSPELVEVILSGDDEPTKIAKVKKIMQEKFSHDYKEKFARGYKKFARGYKKFGIVEEKMVDVDENYVPQDGEVIRTNHHSDGKETLYVMKKSLALRVMWIPKGVKFIVFSNERNGIIFDEYIMTDEEFDTA